MHVTLRSMTDPQNRSLSMATAAGGRIARRQLDVWEILFLERLSNVERLFIQTEKCYKMSCILYSVISTPKSRVIDRSVRMPCELGAMNSRIAARSITIILRRRWRQADGRAHIKNVKDGGYDHERHAWDETLLP